MGAEKIFENMQRQNKRGSGKAQEASVFIRHQVRNMRNLIQHNFASKIFDLLMTVGNREMSIDPLV